MLSSSTSWAIIAHGGAKEIAPAEEGVNREGLNIAIEAGSKILANGGSALDAVEAVVKMLENDPAYNAGLFGCVKNEVGEIHLDASIMDGKTLEIGAVAGLNLIRHPVSVARALLKEKAIFLIGKGANKFAKERNFDNGTTPTPNPNAVGCDTVGCVARDIHGNLAAATSTGGLDGVKEGRVGDVPLPGCGFYADNRRGAVSCSGEGEAIARVLVASEFLRYLQENEPDEAANRALKPVQEIGGDAGIIAITPKGQIVWSHNSPNFAVGMADASSDPKIYLKKSEEV